jgi:hypothetical protein
MRLNSLSQKALAKLFGLKDHSPISHWLCGRGRVNGKASRMLTEWFQTNGGDMGLVVFEDGEEEEEEVVASSRGAPSTPKTPCRHTVHVTPGQAHVQGEDAEEGLGDAEERMEDADMEGADGLTCDIAALEISMHEVAPSTPRTPAGGGGGRHPQHHHIPPTTPYTSLMLAPPHTASKTPKRKANGGRRIADSDELVTVDVTDGTPSSSQASCGGAGVEATAKVGKMSLKLPGFKFSFCIGMHGVLCS